MEAQHCTPNSMNSLSAAGSRENSLKTSVMQSLLLCTRKNCFVLHAVCVLSAACFHVVMACVNTCPVLHMAGGGRIGCSYPEGGRRGCSSPEGG